MDDEDLLDAHFDPGSDAWFANLLFWRPSHLSDEQMQLHFSDWDGRWSLLTKRALQRTAAKGLDLNENWALCPPSWACPACGRAKDQIFRLSKRGILLAKLELHHDHWRDQIWDRARELFGVEWRETVPNSSLFRLDQICDLSSRFDACLICSECNTADGKVKGRFRSEIDSRFSFIAPEIGAFISSRPGDEHHINYERAHEIWRGEKNNFLARARLTDDLLTHVVEGRLTCSHDGVRDAKGVASAFDMASVLMRSFHWKAKDTERVSLLGNFRGEFLARSTQRDSATVTLSTKPVGEVIAPTDEEYNTYVDPVSPKSWQKATETWLCPVCERTKRQIVRKGKSGKWTGGIRSHYECTLEDGALAIANRRKLFPDFQNEIFIKQVVPVLLCADCAAVGPTLSQRDQTIRDPYLGIDDRRASIILSRPHGTHEIDFEVAAERAIANEPYGSAMSAFHAFRERVGDFGGRLEVGRKWNVPEEKLLGGFAEDVRVSHRIDTAAECMSLARWLVTQYAEYTE